MRPSLFILGSKKRVNTWCPTWLVPNCSSRLCAVASRFGGAQDTRTIQKYMNTTYLSLRVDDFFGG
jgi:hypothetical protein